MGLEYSRWPGSGEDDGTIGELVLFTGEDERERL